MRGSICKQSKWRMIYPQNIQSSYGAQSKKKKKKMGGRPK